MSKNEEEVSVRSRESVDSLRKMGDAESTKNETQQRQTVCAWARREQALDSERERIHPVVVTQGMAGGRMDSLW